MATVSAVPPLAPDVDLLRNARAREIVAAGGVRPLGGTRYAVHSQESETVYYLVDYATQTCPCYDRKHRGMWCKHLRAAVLFATQVSTVEPEQPCC